MSRYNERSSCPSKLKKAWKVIPLDERGRYDVWSRSQSDTFRKDVAEVLCKRGGVSLDLSTDPYNILSSIPDPDWALGSLEPNLSYVQLKALFQKDEDLRTPIDTEQVAWESFQESEVRCRSVNDAFLENRFGADCPDVEQILIFAKRKIAEILGDAPRIIDLLPSFGPGAAVTCRKKTSARFKLSTLPSISKPSLGILFQMALGVNRWLDLHGRSTVVVAGSLEFVAKNYKTKRAIVIGPSLTGMYQRAVGSLMKRKLLKAGIDLYGAKSSIAGGQGHQRERARLASLTGDDATIDLKAASDSIAYMLCLELLPIKWFELLDSLRDDRVRYRETTVELEKFSSMGCGFTFELETLLFYALSYGIARTNDIPIDGETISIYGDDIIVPHDLAVRIIERFPYFGFVVNKEKSFIDGPFRESCGGDYVRGVDVRPFFIRDRMTHHKLVGFYNHMQRKPHQDPDRSIRELILSILPERFKNFGPDGYGDGHLVSGADLCSYAVPLKRKAFGWSGWTFETYIEIPNRDDDEQIGDLLLPSYTIALKKVCDDPWVEELSREIAHLRGYQRDAYLRQRLADEGTALDHFVLRKDRGTQSRARKIRVYVLGPR